MKYLLDTNVCVDYLNGRYPPVAERLRRTKPEQVRVSSIAVAELRYGADKSANPAGNHGRLDVLLGELECVAFDLEAASHYGRVRESLERRGNVIGPNDLLIAAHALSLGVVLVTDNTREFAQVEGLRLENWRLPVTERR